MKGEDISVKAIGIVEKVGEISEIRIFPEYHQGLFAIEDYEKLMILFWMHLQDNEEGRSRLMSSRPRHGREGFRGVFATHSSHRPNPVGVTVVELMKVEGGRLYVKGFDALLDTPIIDIKSA